jgi:signal transduction histidine kinase
MPATSSPRTRQTPVLIAGGIAVAPLVGFASGVIQLIAALSFVAIAAAASSVGDRPRRPGRRAVIADARARGELRRCQQEQAALRRVVKLLTRQTSPELVFAAITDELEQLGDIRGTTMVRYEPDGTVCVVARAGDAGPKATVSTPIVIDGRPWGAVLAVAGQGEPLPAGTEPRIQEFTELLATAIANLEARSELAASRARIAAAAEAERRRVVRDVHDGAQQRMVNTVITLKLARQALDTDETSARALAAEALNHAEHAIDDLRSLSRGLLPTVLMRGGLGPAIGAIASSMSVPVEVDVSVGRLPAAVEASAYFTVAEALSNVAKHAKASGVAVTARVKDDTLQVNVRDDGAGGARVDGSGLLGIADRIATLDGRLRVETAAEGGTLVAADIPLIPARGTRKPVRGASPRHGT